jgi:hypothetical protein
MRTGSTTSDANSQPAVIYRMLHDLSHHERAELLHNLQQAADDLHAKPRRVASRRWIVRFLALCCLGLVPWTIGLAVTLPRSYLVGNWPLAWTGFDVILLGCLSTTAWALWKQRQVAVPASMITSVLLLCDAWFDILTAHGGRCLMLSIATAVFAEVPIAILLGVISVRLQHASVRVARRVESHTAFQPLWRTPLITSAEVPSTLGKPPGEDGGATSNSARRAGGDAPRSAAPTHGRRRSRVVA